MIRVASCLAIAVTLVSGDAAAATKRLAVVVGSNAGAGDRTPLRFAETDAGKLARVLVELGGIAREDVLLLQGQPLEAVDAALRTAQGRVTAWKSGGIDRVLILFFFSGHSDGEALEVGRDRLTYTRLRSWLDGTGADVRVAIVDACRSGSLLAEKGGKAGPGFDVRLVDDLATTGNVLLASSAADEVALESTEIGGSFFTHHFVSGLRGAADTSGDSRVTLMEAYRHAFDRTVATTSSLVAGAQHPTFDMELSGQGELVLTELSRPGASLELPQGFDRAFVINAARDVVAAELRAGDPRTVAIEPGAYTVRLWRGDQLVGGRVDVSAGGRRAVTWEELQPIATSTPWSKGGARPAPQAWAFQLGAGVGVGIANDGAPRLDVRIGVAPPIPVTFDVVGRVGRGPGYLEAGGFLLAGWPVKWPVGEFEVGVVPLAGVAVVSQMIDGGDTLFAVPPVAGARVFARWNVAPTLSIGLEAGGLAGAVRVDGALSLVPMPSAALAVAWTP